MVLMLLDHLRETWFLHVAVADPVDARTIEPALYFGRLAAGLCAPILVALTGLGAYLYERNHTRTETSRYLVHRCVHDRAGRASVAAAMDGDRDWPCYRVRA